MWWQFARRKRQPVRNGHRDAGLRPAFSEPVAALGIQKIHAIQNGLITVDAEYVGCVDWTAVVAGPQGTTHFVVVPAASFADFGMATPEPPEVLAQHYGMTEARELMEMFAGAMTFRQSRMWVRRPDLSFGPG